MDEDFPTPDVEVASIGPESLKNRIDGGEGVTLLDIRMEAEYGEWRIDGGTVTSINIPYFEFLDDDIDGDALARVPDDREVTVVCAKGGRSIGTSSSVARSPASAGDCRGSVPARPTRASASVT
jgi:rhodanese-related sulfurtransferase